MPWADLLVAWRQVALYEHDYLYPMCAEIAKRAGLYSLSHVFDQLGSNAYAQVEQIYHILIQAFPRQIDPIHLHAILAVCYGSYGRFHKLIQVLTCEQQKQRALSAATF
jgi:hypothetical protein